MFECIAQLRQEKPLIHCITNPISITQCANAILAVGAQPIMAEHPSEVEEIVSHARSLLLNLGNITDVRMESMLKAALVAQQKQIPILLDAVGIACSRLRHDYVQRLLKIVTPTVIKGNYSEIQALAQPSYRVAGVDAEDTLTPALLDRSAVNLTRQYHAIVVASGKVDVITDGIHGVHIHNGTPQLTTITGTGCMLGALGAAYLSTQPDMEAMITACAVLGIAGERAETPKGSGSFFVGLLDALSTLQKTDIEHTIRMEKIRIETI